MDDDNDDDDDDDDNDEDNVLILTLLIKKIKCWLTSMPSSHPSSNLSSA